MPRSTTKPAVRRAGAALVCNALRAKLSPSARSLRRRRDAFHREVWLSAAAELGLSARGRGGSAVEIELGPQLSFTVSRSASSIEDAEALDRAGDKALVLGLLAAHGIPVPDHTVATLDALDTAEGFLAAAGTCVVKPARDTSGGRGVTTAVRDRDTLRDAAVSAAAAGARAGRSTRRGSLFGRLRAKYGDLAGVPLLVERHVVGANYRLLYLDGTLIDAVRRAVPYAVGDGSATVRALVARSAAERSATPVERGGDVVTVDEDLRNTLRQQGMTVDTVPARGALVALKTAVNEGAIADQTPARDVLCADIVEQCARAAELTGGRLVGVDIITPDPSVPLNAAGGCVIEVNTTPGLAYHYHGNPGGVDVARAVLTRLAGVHAHA